MDLYEMHGMSVCGMWNVLSTFWLRYYDVKLWKLLLYKS